MELDLHKTWRLFLSTSEGEGFLSPELMAPILARPETAQGPGEYAAAELAQGLSLLGSPSVEPGRGDEAGTKGIIILSPGNGASLGPEARRGFAWRANAERLEIHGDSEAGLLAGVEDFLFAAGLLWPSPDRGPVCLRPGRIEIPRATGRRSSGTAQATLILGHGSYLGEAEAYLPWAVRNGYACVFFHTISDPLAFGAAPLVRYEAMRPRLLPLAARLGLELELGGHGLAGLLPRRLFAAKPELFRMSQGERRADKNFCPSNPETLALIKEAFLDLVRKHPETSVFHLWPDDLPGGGWCSCPRCSSLSPGRQSLLAALSLAEALAAERPHGRLSFLAYHDTEDLEIDPREIPGNLELLWAPRRRSWAKGYGDRECVVNRESSERFEKAAAAFSQGPRPKVSLFEYWEDAILFKTAVPPLGATLAQDLLYYADKAARVGILLTGDGLPLGPRLNVWLMPHLLSAAAEGAATPESMAKSLETLKAAWLQALYGPAAEAMGEHWTALEEAWRIDLDVEPGETDPTMPESNADLARNPPSDWGDPWKASLERLAEKRGHCEALFDWQRRAEAALEQARLLAKDSVPALAAVEAQAAEYAKAAAVLELDCARLSAYHEMAAGQIRAGADIALIGLTLLGAAGRARKAMPDRRARRNSAFLLEYHYGLKLRALARSPRGRLRRGIGEVFSLGRIALQLLGLRRVWEK